MKTSNIKRSQKQINADLIEGLSQIEKSQLNLPLVPLNGNKQPLGDNWQQRPMSAKEIRVSLEKTGSIKIPMTLNKGQDNEKQVIKDLPIQGFGVLLGHPITYQNGEYYLTAIDVDGVSAHQLIPSLSGSEKLLKTIGFTSGRNGRCQALYLVPAELASLLKYKKIKTGLKDEDGKDEALEFRWTGQQSVLPPSVHPSTGKYTYYEGFGLETEIALAPNWVILQMLQSESVQGKLVKLALENKIELKFDGDLLHEETLAAIDAKVNLIEIVQEHLPLRKSGKGMIGKCCFHDDKGEHLIVERESNVYYCSECEATGGVTKFVRSWEQQKFSQTNHQQNHQKVSSSSNAGIKTVVSIPESCNWSEGDWAAYYVLRLASWRADDYDAWIKVGMALHSLKDESMLAVFDRFSQQNPKYKPGECEKKWRSFGRSGLTVASIYEWAKNDLVPPPNVSEFKRCVELLYAEYADGKIDRSTLNFNLLEARKNFWTWRNSDLCWKDLVDEVRSQFGLTNDKNEIIYGNSSYVDRAETKNKNRDKSDLDSPPESSNKVDGDNVPLIELIREIFGKYPYSESKRISALQDLAQQIGRNFRDIELLARIISSEGEEAENIIEALALIKNNLSEYRSRLGPLYKYLPEKMARLIEEAAAAMPTAPEYLFNTLLVTAASCIGTSSRIVINESGGYTQPCIFWTTNVNHSGQAKTPPQEKIVDPLEGMETKAYERYQAALAEYENDSTGEIPKPSRTRFILNNSTVASKLRLQAENPRGLTEYIDEMSSDFNRLNQYKGGKGDDLQTELQLFNGKGLNVDRKDDKIRLNRTAISKTGTHQWETIARLMNNKPEFIETGYASRFLFCSIIDAPSRHLNLFSKSQAVPKLQEFLSWLYEALRQVRQCDYLIDDDAKRYFQAWNHHLTDLEIAEKNSAIGIVYAKIESYTARLALWLHVVSHVAEGYDPPCTISGETMQKAIEIANFYLCQYKLIITHNGVGGDQLEGNLLKIQTLAEKYYRNQQLGVGASFLKSRINSLRKLSTDKIRALLNQLVVAGLGVIEGIGSKMRYIPIFNPGNNGGYRRGNGNNPSTPGGNNPSTPGGNNPSTPGWSNNSKNPNPLGLNNNLTGGFESKNQENSTTIVEKLLAPTIAQIETDKELETTIVEIVGNNSSPNIKREPPLVDFSREKTSSVEFKEPVEAASSFIKNNNFNNILATTIEKTRVTAIVDEQQSEHQSTTEIIEVESQKEDSQRELTVNTSEENCDITSSSVPIRWEKPPCGTVTKAMLNFYSCYFLVLLEAEQSESQQASQSILLGEINAEVSPPINLIPASTEELEELEDLEIEIEPGMKVVNTVSRVEAIAYSVSKRNETVTVRLANGDFAKWYEYMVVPAPGTVVTYDRIKQAIDAQIQRLGWTIEQAKDYLFSQFRVRQRHLLSDDQLFQFLAQLQTI